MTDKSKEPQPKACIYALVHPETGQKRFIEYTFYLLPEKLYRIRAVAKYGDGSLRSRWVRTLADRGLVPGIVLLEQNATKPALSRWKKEYQDELLENTIKRKPRHGRSSSAGASEVCSSEDSLPEEG